MENFDFHFFLPLFNSNSNLFSLKHSFKKLYPRFINPPYMQAHTHAPSKKKKKRKNMMHAHTHTNSRTFCFTYKNNHDLVLYFLELGMDLQHANQGQPYVFSFINLFFDIFYKNKISKLIQLYYNESKHHMQCILRT